MNSPWCAHFSMRFPLLFAIALAAVPSFAQNESDGIAGADSAVRALLVPRVESVLSSQTTAQIMRIAVAEGERFKEGDVLVEFRCDETRAELLKSRAELRAAGSTHQANLKLREHNAVSPLEVAVSGAKVDQARADVALWEARIAHCSINAPFPGRVANIAAKPFETVTQGAPLLEVLDDRELNMELHVPSTWVSWLVPGSGFKVSIDETRKTYNATITSLGARVDPVSQTLQVNAVIDGQHDELLAGMSGIARFPEPQ